MSDEAKELQSVSRRNFLELVGKGSFTAAMVAGAAGVLSSSEAVAQTAAEERKREKEAAHVMTVATAYVLGASRSYPILQLDLKENIQNSTNGKIYVKLAPVDNWEQEVRLPKKFKMARSKPLNTPSQTLHLSLLLLT